MLVAFSGFKTAGKDAAASVLINEYGFQKIALADPVRDLAYAINPIVEVEVEVDQYGGCATGCCGITQTDTTDVRLRTLIDNLGWDYCKNEYPEVRRLMQAVGTEGGRALFGENFWVDQLAAKYDFTNDDERYVLTDARFLNEGRFVQDNGGTLIWIDRPGLGSDGHASESGELREIADYIITNDGPLADLQEDVRFMSFMRDIYHV